MQFISYGRVHETIVAELTLIAVSQSKNFVIIHAIATHLEKFKRVGDIATIESMDMKFQEIILKYI
jgi:hypothetical protein